MMVMLGTMHDVFHSDDGDARDGDDGDAPHGDNGARRGANGDARHGDAYDDARHGTAMLDMIMLIVVMMVMLVMLVVALMMPVVVIDGGDARHGADGGDARHNDSRHDRFFVSQLTVRVRMADGSVKRVQAKPRDTVENVCERVRAFTDTKGG